MRGSALYALLLYLAPLARLAGTVPGSCTYASLDLGFCVRLILIFVVVVALLALDANARIHAFTRSDALGYT